MQVGIENQDNSINFEILIFSIHTNKTGEVAEWSKANDSKSFNRVPIRGFESHPLRQYLIFKK